MKKTIDSKKYKALMLDVDGTLVENSPDALPSAKVIEALQKAQNKVHVGIVTGRPLEDLQLLFDHLPLSSPLIIDNGTRIIDNQTKEVLWEKSLLSSDITAILDIFKKKDRTIWLNEENKSVLFHSLYTSEKVYTIVALGFTPQESEETIALFSQIPTIAIHPMISWTKGFIDIGVSHAEASKQHGIFEVAKLLHIETHDIIGVGDGPNDFPLLMACGLKVAMGNAAEDLKAIADYVAPSVEEDGVADVIAKFIL